uniref:PUM-HD domain-containing protein n=1 Tax=Globodera rostochiensis TaxID=31243 RepID=A0A914H0X0_GLORO
MAHMIEHGLPEDRKSIVRSLQRDIMKNACAHFGYGSMAHMLEHGLPEDRERIVCSLQRDIMKNACAHFGYGSMAHMIEHGLPEDRERIVRSLKGNILKDAHHKGICNVIEKCLSRKCVDRPNLCGQWLWQAAFCPKIRIPVTPLFAAPVLHRFPHRSSTAKGRCAIADKSKKPNNG